MATTPALFDSMAQQVAQTVEKRLADARQEADRIRAEGQRTAEELYTRGMESARAEIEAADRRTRQQVSSEAEKNRLAAQHQVVEEVLEEVRRELARRADSPGFVSVLEALLAEILEQETRNDLVVLAPAAHVDAVRSWLEQTGRGGLTVEPWPDVVDGVAVQDPRRTFRISNTLSGRLEIVINHARKLCQDRLFGEG